MIVRSKRVVERGLHAPVVRACVEEFLLTQPRLERLKRYYDGAHAIGDRLREPGPVSYTHLGAPDRGGRVHVARAEVERAVRRL